MKHIYFILILLVCAGLGNAADIVNETNIFEDFTKVGDSNDKYVIPHFHYWDSWFCLYNDKGVSYQVYMYDYNGDHPNNYTNSFIGTIKPDQMITLNSEASYCLYASYDDISGLTTETIEKKINQYWFIGILLFILIIFGIVIIRKVIR